MESTKEKDQKIDKELKWYQDLSEKGDWYFDAAADYDRARPRYSEEFLNEILLTSGLQNAEMTAGKKTIVEIGCGPGIVSIPLAKKDGLNLTCVEPNRRFVEILQKHCQDEQLINNDEGEGGGSISVECCTFEEFSVNTDNNERKVSSFDAVLAANALHWVDPSVVYQKAWELLKPHNGRLIVLWHMRPEPSTRGVYDLLLPAFSHISPEQKEQLCLYEGRSRQEEVAAKMGQKILESGFFENLQTNAIPWSKVYTAQEYIALLNTLSPYIRLEEEQRRELFLRIHEIIRNELSGSIQLSNICVYHIARPVKKKTKG